MAVLQELCWIGILGTGMGFSKQDVDELPLGELPDWIDWSEDRRRREYRALAKR